MKRYLVITLLLLVALLTSACEINMVTGSGRVTTQNRTVAGFNAVTFAGLGELTITQGSTEGLTIEAEDNILDKIKTEVKNGSLYIGFIRDNWQDVVRPTRTIKFDLKVRNLNTLDLTGLGSITLAKLQGEAITIKVSGAGGVKISQVSADSLTAVLSGAGGVDIAGKVVTQTITLAGAGNYNAGDLESQNTTVTLSGLGNATVWTRNTLNVKITGAGSVGYYGSPKITKEISGLGVLNSMGNK